MTFVAALATLAATGAYAQATIYGSMDVCYINHTTENVAGTVAAKSSGLGESCFAGPRIGFKGTEDLGNGLKGSYNIEWGYSILDPNGNKVRVTSAGHQNVGSAGGYGLGTNRNSFVALNGGFGEVKAGYTYTSSYELLATISGMGGETQGSNHLDGSAGSRGQIVKYTAPAFNGVTFKLDYGSTTGKLVQENTSGMGDDTTRNNSTLTALSAVYNQGPLMAGYVYSRNQQDKVADTTNAGANVFGAAVTAVTSNTVGTSTNQNLVVTYDLGMAKLGMANSKVTSTAGIGTKVNNLAVNVPYGKATFMLVTGTTKSDDGKKNLSANLIGAKYALTKTTTAYFLQGENKDTGTSAGTAALPAKDTRSMVGLNMSF